MLTKKDKFLNDRIEQGMRRALALLLAGMVCYRIFLLVREGNMWPGAFLLLYVAGLAASVLLLLKTYGFHSRAIDRFCCDKSGRADCSAVIGSKGAFLVGEISWSDVGVVYFLAMSAVVLIFPFDGNEMVYILSAFLALPYTVFSIGYQWRVVRVWCRLCLIVQFILLLSAGMAMGLLFSGQSAGWPSDWFRIAVVILLTVACWFTVKYIVKGLLQGKAVTEQYKLFKFDNAAACLYVSDTIEPLKTSARLVFHEGAQNKITVVFRFDCQPCLYSMGEIIETIRKNRNTAVEFVFVSWASKLQKDLPVILYFTILYLQNPDEFLETLERYVADFPSGINKYAVKPDFIDDKVKVIVKSHLEWCMKNGIKKTPTYLLHNRMVSSHYTFNDLMELL